MVVKMTVKEDCSRVCARVLSESNGKREVVVGYISGGTGSILGPTKVVGLWLHFISPPLCLTCSQESRFESITGLFLLRGANIMVQGGCLPGDSCCDATIILEQRWQQTAHARLHLQQTGPTSAPAPIHLQAEGEMPFMHRAGLQAAGRQADNGATHSTPPPPSSPRGGEAPVCISPPTCSR